MTSFFRNVTTVATTVGTWRKLINSALPVQFTAEKVLRFRFLRGEMCRVRTVVA